MRRTHRLPARLIRWTSPSVCFVLVFSCLVVTPLAKPTHNSKSLGQGQSGSPNVKKVEPAPPVTGPPTANLPNLDEVKQRQQEAPRTPEPVSSTLRSRRKPIESRHGRKVGDPLPPQKISSYRIESDSDRVSNVGVNTLRMSKLSVRSHHAGSTRLLSTRRDSSASSRRKEYGHRNLIAGPEPQGPPNSATFVTIDTTTQGNWKGVYGADGYNVINDATSYPSYAQVSVSGQNAYTWAASTSDGRAPLKAASTSDRIAACWYTSTNFVVDINLTDGNEHKVALYSLDWDGNNGRQQQIQVLDGGTNAVLDSRNVLSFSGGQYTVWKLRGHVKLQVNFLGPAGANAVISGLFFDPSSSSRTNYALASNGANASASSQYNSNFPAASVNNGDRKGTNWANGGGWADSSSGSFPDWVQIDFSGSKTISEVDVFTIQDNYTSPSEPTEAMTFSIYGNTAFEVQYWSGSAWTDVPTGNVTGNNKVWRKFNFTAITTSKIRVLINDSVDHANSRLTEVEAWSYEGAPPPRTNVALTSNGSVATASSTYSGYPFSPGATLDGEHKGLNWLNGGGWNDGTTQYPDWLEVDFSGSKTIDEIDVYTVQDNYANPIEPTETTTFSTYGNTAFEVQYWNGSAFVDVPDGNVTGNNKVWRKFNFTALTTSKIRVLINDSADHIFSRLTEVEAWSAANGGSADPYTQNFIQWALSRQPNSEEINYWEDILRAAYAHGQGSMLLAEREMGRTVFESAEYAARGRSDHLYVYDLYKAYLMREPDSSGWAYWEERVPWMGRDQVRRGFDESTEFANLVSTLTISGTASSAVSSLATARIDPFNQPGNGLMSRDAEWSVPLLSLPGRAGLDLGLSLSYSSMVWTRSGPYMYFDEDRGFPSPGFRLGLPTIQEKFFDAQTGVNVYLLAAAGSRVELRQVGSSNVYEAGDSSYLQLIDTGGLMVRTTDGTKLSYAWFDHEYRCIEIKDRNGNYLTVNYDWRGDITNLTDTLGRVITFNYDGNANPISITQTWNGQTHTWATFGWGNLSMQASMSGVVGTYGGESIPVLTQVSFPDISHYNFEYTGNGQVNAIRRYTFDNVNGNVQRSYTAYDYAPSADSSPRLTGQRVWAENWTGLPGVPNEVVTQFSDPGDGSHVMTAPDGTIYKEIYGTSWQKGLTTQSEVWSGGVRQKWTTTAWTQDNTSVNYQTNPRVTETNIYDVAGNRRRTTIDYGSYAQYGLPNGVFEYAADGVTLLRVTYTDYNLSQAYLDSHIIGLVSAVHVSDGAWRSKVIYSYDAAGDQLQATGAAAIQHDAAYGTGFITGRGNVTAVSRYDVTDIGNDSKALTTRMGYDIDGSVVFARDALNHQTTMSYNDAFSSTGTSLDAPRSFATFAYPTTITDPDGYSSSLWYRYDFGAKTRAQGPPPAGQTQGAIQTLAYDDAVRLQQVTTANTGAYTRYVHGPNYVQSFSSINSVADDSYAFQVFDGVGHTIFSGGSHPGSTGLYRMVNTIYDLIGRVFKQSNPTEIYGNGVPAGDDAAGWIFTQQTYDWKGRPLVTTHLADGTQKYASYTACGCAGSEVTTLTDEVGRQQKVYRDVLGRTAKTEILQTVNNITSVYSTTSNTYNARDQVTQVRQYQGADNGSVYQDTTMSYDGYGRLQSKHVPEQNANTATTYAYNADDTVYSDTDARSATCTYGYNNRHQVTSATHTLSGQTTIALSYGYDAAGNKASMTDGLGSKSYNYNQLSQLTSETRTITNVGTFTISYDYNLAGELKKVSDPANATINYGFDSIGRLNSVTGSDNLFAGILTYASNFQYRAFDAVKGLTYGNSKTLSVGYDNRLQASSYEVPGILKKSYQRNNDSSLQFSQDQLIANSKFDRSYNYDHLGRISTALSGAEARSQGPTDDRPYNEANTYDAMDHLTSHEVLNWDTVNSTGTQTYINNRNPSWVYDADGRLTVSSTGNYVYDAAGKVSSFGDGDPFMTDQQFDGDGNRVKSVQRRYDDQTSQWVTDVVTYCVNSTVLGGKLLTELTAQGAKQRTSVYAGGTVLAWQSVATNGSQSVAWEHRDASGASLRMTDAAGQGTGQPAEMDPMGANAGLFKPLTWNVPDKIGQLAPFYGIADMLNNPGGACTVDRMPIPCEMLSNDNSAECPNGDCGPKREYNPATKQVEWRFFQSFADGSQGYLPLGATSNGDGGITLSNGDEGWGDLYSSSKGSLPQNPGIDLSKVETLLKTPTCRDFLNGVLAELGKATGRGRAGVSFEDLFKAARGSIYGDPNWKSRASASPDGILIGDPGFRITVNTTNETAESIPTTVMHEIIHGAPSAGANYSHTQMVLAAFTVADAMGMTKDHDYPLQRGEQPQNFDAAKTYDEKVAVDKYNSSRFQQILTHACR